MSRCHAVVFAAWIFAGNAGAAEPATEPRGAGSTIDPEFRKDLRRLLELTNSGKLAVQSFHESLKMQARQQPLPPGFWEEFEKEATEEAFIELVLPIYAKHLKPADVKAMIVFYESPAGKALVEAQPAILRDSMEAGAKFGANAAFKAGLRAGRKNATDKKATEKKPANKRGLDET